MFWIISTYIEHYTNAGSTHLQYILPWWWWISGIVCVCACVRVGGGWSEHGISYCFVTIVNHADRSMYTVSNTVNHTASILNNVASCCITLIVLWTTDVTLLTTLLVLLHMLVAVVNTSPSFGSNVVALRVTVTSLLTQLTSLWTTMLIIPHEHLAHHVLTYINYS